MFLNFILIRFFHSRYLLLQHLFTILFFYIFLLLLFSAVIKLTATFLHRYLTPLSLPFSLPHLISSLFSLLFAVPKVFVGYLLRHSPTSFSLSLLPIVSSLTISLLATNQTHSNTPFFNVIVFLIPPFFTFFVISILSFLSFFHFVAFHSFSIYFPPICFAITLTFSPRSFRGHKFDRNTSFFGFFSHFLKFRFIFVLSILEIPSAVLSFHF